MPGFTEYERSKMSELLDTGFVDTWRFLHPQEPGHTVVFAFDEDACWRLDYILVPCDLANRVQRACIDFHSYGSDHCPVEMELEA